MNNGTYRCMVVSNCLAQSKDKGTPSVKIQLGVKYNLLTPGIPEQASLYWDGWLSDAAFERTMDTLQAVFGWAGEDIQELNNPDLLFGYECNAVVEMENYEGKDRPKVKFLNNPNFAGKVAALKDTSAKELSGKLMGKILAYRNKNRGKAVLPPVKATEIPETVQAPSDDGSNIQLPPDPTQGDLPF